MANDFTKMPLAILVDLINVSNNCSLALSDITFSPPINLLFGNRNTGITVTATPTSIYTGSRDLTYNRINMAMIPGTRSTEFLLGGAKTMRDLVPLINETYLLNLQPEDYYDDILPDLSDQTLTDMHFVLRAKPGSYIFTGKMVLSAGDGKITIGDYLTQDLLSGFILPSMDTTLQGDQVLNGFYFLSPPPI